MLGGVYLFLGRVDVHLLFQLHANKGGKVILLNFAFLAYSFNVLCDLPIDILRTLFHFETHLFYVILDVFYSFLVMFAGLNIGSDVVEINLDSEMNIFGFPLQFLVILELLLDDFLLIRNNFVLNMTKKVHQARPTNIFDSSYSFSQKTASIQVHLRIF